MEWNIGNGVLTSMCVFKAEADPKFSSKLSAQIYSCPSRDDAKNNNPIVKLVQMSVQPGKGGEMPTLEDDLEADLLLALEAEASSEEVKYAVIAFNTILNLNQK